MKTLRSLAIASFFLAPAGLILALPSASRADDGFRISYSAGAHDAYAVTVALGHLVGVHVGYEQPHRAKHRKPYVSHETRWHYAYRVPRRDHVHDGHCGHRARVGKRAHIDHHDFYWPARVFSVRPEHTKQHVATEHRRQHRKQARMHRSRYYRE